MVVHSLEMCSLVRDVVCRGCCVSLVRNAVAQWLGIWLLIGRAQNGQANAVRDSSLSEWYYSTVLKGGMFTSAAHGADLNVKYCISQ